MKLIKKVLPFAAASLLPLSALAQTVDTGYLNQLEQLLNAVIPVLLIIATLVFIWGVITYITAGADEEKSANARNFIIYGVIALAVIIAVWGIVKIIVTAFGVENEGIPTTIGTIDRKSTRLNSSH